MSASVGITTKKPRKKLDEHTGIEKLRTTSLRIKKSGFLRDWEIQRASSAVKLMENEINPNDKYQTFLRNVQRHSQPQNVAPLVRLCALALGGALIRRSKNEVLLDLPEKIAALEGELVNNVLKDDTEMSVTKQPASSHTLPGRQEIQRQISTQDDSSPQIPSSPPPNITGDDQDSVPLELKLKDLTEFLSQLGSPNQILQMRFPLSGDPLPSINLGSQQFGDASAKLELSQPLATTFIRYMMERRQV